MHERMKIRMEKKRLEDRLGHLALRYPAPNATENNGDNIPTDLDQTIQGVNPDGITQAIENDVDIMEGIEFEVDEIGNIVN